MLIIMSIFLLLIAAGLFWLGYHYIDDPKGTRPNTHTPSGKIIDRESYQKWEGRFLFIGGTLLILIVVSLAIVFYFDLNPQLLRFWTVMIIVMPIIRMIVLSKFIEFKWQSRK